MVDHSPYSPPASLPGNPIGLHSESHGKSLRQLVVLQFIIIVVALAAQFYDIATIMASGIPFAIVGTLIAVFGFRTGDRTAGWYGISAVVFALLILTLVNVNNWTTLAASLPVAVLSIGYGIVALWATWAVVFRHPGLADNK